MGAKRQHLCVVRSNIYTDDGPMAICGEYFKAETFPLTLHAYKKVMTIYKCTCSHAACFRFAHMGARALSNDLMRIHRYCWRDTFSFKWKKTGINHLQVFFFLLLTEPKRASATLKTPQQEVRRKQIKDVCSTKKDKFAISTGTKRFLTSPLCLWCALTDEPPLQLERSTWTQGQTDIVSL